MKFGDAEPLERATNHEKTAILRESGTAIHLLVQVTTQVRW